MAVLQARLWRWPRRPEAAGVELAKADAGGCRWGGRRHVAEEAVDVCSLYMDACLWAGSRGGVVGRVGAVLSAWGVLQLGRRDRLHSARGDAHLAPEAAAVDAAEAPRRGKQQTDQVVAMKLSGA